MIKFFFAFTCLFASLSCFGQQPPEFEKTLKLDEQGNDQAQCNLGTMYADGKGVVEDDVLAVKWYRKAANKGYYGLNFHSCKNEFLCSSTANLTIIT